MSWDDPNRYDDYVARALATPGGHLSIGRHRALRHHAEGCFAAEALFEPTLTNSAGREVPVRLVTEQHILEDLGCIPSFADWLRCIRPEPWMGRVGVHLADDTQTPDQEKFQ